MKSLEETINNLGFGKFNLCFIIIISCLNMSDAMEIMLLTFIGPLLECDWKITLIEQSMITTFVFIGMMLGAPLLGKLSDLIGRKTVLLLCGSYIAYVGLLSALSPTIIWIILFRSIVGFFVGGMLSSVTSIVSEIMPTKQRGFMLIVSLAFWPIGSIIVTLLCLLIAPKFGWRIFLVSTNISLLFTLPFLYWIPESPRNLIIRKRKSEAIYQLNRIAKLNKKPAIDDVETLDTTNNVSLMDVFHPNYLRTFLICLYMYIINGLNYYGGSLLIAIINSIPRRCLQNMSNIYMMDNSMNNGTDSCCIQLTIDNYVDTFISVFGELIISLLSYPLIDKFGRKPILIMNNVIASFLFLFLNFCVPIHINRIFLFFLKGFLLSNFSIGHIYAAEVFPTSVRAFTIGCCNSFSRIGAILSPFIVNNIIRQWSFLYGTLVFVFANFSLAIFVFVLPYETKNRKLCQTANDNPRQYITDEYYEIKNQ